MFCSRGLRRLDRHLRTMPSGPLRADLSDWQPKFSEAFGPFFGITADERLVVQDFRNSSLRRRCLAHKPAEFDVAEHTSVGVLQPAD